MANDRMENIGARRLHTVMSALLEEVLFELPDYPEQADRVRRRRRARAAGQDRERRRLAAVHPLATSRPGAYCRTYRNSGTIPGRGASATRLPPSECVGATVMDQVDRLRAALADRYTLDREIGRGGMAYVYRAHDLQHDRDVAIKVLRPELAAALGTERFLREIRIEARLQHPHILPLYDSGVADGFFYYVMPYVTGEKPPRPDSPGKAAPAE